MKEDKLILGSENVHIMNVDLEKKTIGKTKPWHELVWGGGGSNMTNTHNACTVGLPVGHVDGCCRISKAI